MGHALYFGAQPSKKSDGNNSKRSTYRETQKEKKAKKKPDIKSGLNLHKKEREI
jgi:hypothetical protein